MEPRAWHAMGAEDVLGELDSSREGLTDDQAAQRIDEYGPNQIQERVEVSWVDTLVAQIKNPLVYILLVAVAISFAVAHVGDAIVILVVVALNTVIGFVQEYRAEQAMAELAKLAAPRARVRRSGHERELPSAEVVPGDIVLLAAGDRAPADARLLESRSLEMDESALTGESEPAPKSTEPVEEDAALGDRTDMTYAGTVVTRGRATSVVCATGRDTEFGRIAQDVLSEHRQETPLQRELAALGKRLGLVALGLAALVFLGGTLRGKGLLEMFLFAVAAAVAAVPEGLPAVVTIALAIGLNAMARKNALIRRLPAVEALGSATVIVSDKTGTLTQNRMTVRAVRLPGTEDEIKDDQVISDERARPLLTAAALANDAEVKIEDGSVTASGDPTEAALVVAAARAGLVKKDLENECGRISEIPFESERGYMATLHRCTDGVYVFLKGAPEVVLHLASLARVDGEDVRIDDDLRREASAANEDMAGRALRVLAVARRKVDDSKTTLDESDLADGLVHIGLVGMIDPPRPEAIEAVEKCRKAGVRVKMATGDNKNTARAIARDFNLISEDSLVVDGSQLSKMTDKELRDRLERITVFARVDPEHKLRIVRTLKDMGEIVAVTGDGVNDAPALKKADIGIAMGKTGTAVAREAGDMVLADDNFATIVAAVEEGRIVFERIQKVVSYLIATNAGEILTIAVAVAAGWPLPVTAVQLLWVNLITDSAPSLALATDPPSEDVLSRPPRSPQESIVNARTIQRLSIVAPVMAVVSLAAFFVGYDGSDPTRGRTMAFVALSSAQLFNAVNVRSALKSVFVISPLSNLWLVGALFTALVLQVLPVEVPFVQGAFDTIELTPEQWGIAIGLASAVLWVEELRKLVLRLLSR